MKIINQSPFLFAPLAGRINFPGTSITLIVKGSFDLADNKKAAIAKTREYPCGDTFYIDDIEMEKAPRYPSDFSFFKPAADFFCVGHCYPANSKNVQACPVEFHVGTRQKKLLVFGNRTWIKTLGVNSISPPDAFSKMELRYENSFGGNGFEKNPHGKGYIGKNNRKTKEVSLPNIENPDNLINDPKDAPDPAGFGPLGAMDPQRFSKMGTYDETWLNNRWPWFAEDFDYRYFNSAAQDQQMDGYLTGDESLFFKNMHPDFPEYRSILPGYRVRCFLNLRQDTGSGALNFKEVNMNLDTLWADMDNEKLTLVWRGELGLKTDTVENEIDHVFIMSEMLDELPAPAGKCRDLFLKALSDEDKEWEKSLEPPSAPPGNTKPGDTEDTQDAEPDTPADELKKQAKEQIMVLMAKLGINADNFSDEQKENITQKQDRIIDKLLENDPVKKKMREAEEQKSLMNELLSKSGIDPDNLPPLSRKAQNEQIRFFKELGIYDPSLFKMPEMLTLLAVFGAVVPKVGLDPENLTPLIEAAEEEIDKKKFKTDHPDEQEQASDEKVILTRRLVLDKVAKKESLANENLSGLDLSNIDMQGIDFSGSTLKNTLLTNSNLNQSIFIESNMEHCDLSNCECRETDFSNANLSGSNLDFAHLDDANFTGAVLSNVQMNHCALNNAILENCILHKASLTQSEAVDLILVNSDCTGADLSGSDFRGADFSQSSLTGVNFSESNLSEAWLEGVSCCDAVFDKSDLSFLRASEKSDFSGSTFIKANGPESIWHGAQLNETDFSFSSMERADFSKTTIAGSKIFSAQMKFTRFINADLSGTSMTRSNLFQAIMEKANFTETDLSGTNLYGAEFLDATFKNTVIKNANLKMTKLKDKMTDR